MTREEAWSRVKANFPWREVSDTYRMMGWQVAVGGGNLGYPSVELLQRIADDLYTRCVFEANWVETARLRVDVTGDAVTLSFVPIGWTEYLEDP